MILFWLSVIFILALVCIIFYQTLKRNNTQFDENSDLNFYKSQLSEIAFLKFAVYETKYSKCLHILCSCVGVRKMSVKVCEGECDEALIESEREMR